MNTMAYRNLIPSRQLARAIQGYWATLPKSRRSDPRFRLNIGEALIPMLAVSALRNAQRRAVASGMPYAVVVDGVLYDVDGNGTRTRLKEFPRRRTMLVRTKTASS